MNVIRRHREIKGGQEMSCDFYTYKGGTLFGDFYCMKKEDTINMDTYNRYCKNYNYKECPIYKSGNSSGCYLTSACIFAKGLKDDCHELTTLRQFRDQWLAKTTKGKKLIKQYYEIAPKVVSSINDREDKLTIYQKIYNKMILPCVEFIENEKYEEALGLYQNWTLKLEKEYVI